MSSKLVFMPWVDIFEEVAIGNFRLKPYCMEASGDVVGLNSSLVKNIFSRYLMRPYTSTDAEGSNPELHIEKVTVVEDTRGHYKDDDIEILKCFGPQSFRHLG